MDNPFETIVYDKDLNFTGFMVDPIYAHFVPSYTNQGYGSFMLAADNPHSEALQEKGARVTVSYRGEHLMSGPIRSRRGDLADHGAVTYQCLDDRRLLVNTLGFVRPTKTLETTGLSDLGQAWLRPGVGAVTAGKVVGQYSYYRWPDGSATFGGEIITSAEQAIKHIIKENLVDRLGRNVTIKPNLGRGGDPTAYLPIVRQETLAEAIQPIINNSGLGVKVWQEPYGDTIFVDVYEPSEWDQELTIESGIVHDGVYSVNAPLITRPIIGGPGGTAGRAFSGLQGTGLLSQDEIDYNDVIEVYRESDAFEFQWPAGIADDLKVPKYYPFVAGLDAGEAARFTDLFTRAIAEGLAAGPPVSTLEMQLSETDTFHFGGPDGIHLGDTVTVSKAGERFTNRITECMLTFTRDKGKVITPLVGQRTDDPDTQLAIALANVAAALRKISTSR